MNTEELRHKASNLHLDVEEQAHEVTVKKFGRLLFFGTQSEVDLFLHGFIFKMENNFDQVSFFVKGVEVANQILREQYWNR